MNTKICSINEVRKNQFIVCYLCDNCGEKSSERKSHFDRKIRHYCSMACYAENRRLWDKSEQPTWRGGVSTYESHKRWKSKNPKRMAHLKARYYARRKNAKGSHSFEEWEDLIKASEGKCALCGEVKPLTKDHIKPLSKGGSDYIENIQPLCRNCNSRKWASYENPELLENENE